MGETLNRQQITEMFEEVKNTFEEKESELCSMDARLGDGDLGLTMKYGFTAIWEFLRDDPETALGKLFFKAGMKMSSKAPSTMGTLMASGFMQAGKNLGDAREFDSKNFCIFVKGFEEGVAKRGKASRGQCTVLDGVGAAADAAEKAFDDGEELAKIVEAAYEGAKFGAESTKEMIPVYGRAAILQGNSTGIMDQGACAAMYMYLGIYNYIKK